MKIPNYILDEMSTAQRWCELGLHKGVLEEAAAGVSIHYLGVENMVGVVMMDGFRCCLDASHYKTKPWFNELAERDLHSPWEGPVVHAEHPHMSASHEKEAERARDYFNGIKSKGKPKLGGGKPRLVPSYIAYEDRPDVGADPKPKLKLKNRPPPPKLKLRNRPND